MRIKKNDIVEVITGKNRGKTGKVLRVYPERNKVLVEGVNNQFKRERPSAKNQQGGITTREAPVDASNVSARRSEDEPSYPHRQTGTPGCRW